MKSVALIPARYAATRFPAKLMQNLGDKTIIRHTYENTRDTLLFDEVIVVTDSEIIFEEIVHNGGYAIMSHGEFESGSDRIAAAAKEMNTDVIFNVQGDEPFVDKQSLEKLVQAFQDDSVQVASLMCPLKEEEVENPNFVKVVVDVKNNALYFSRAPIPFFRNKNIPSSHWKHIGIYGYRSNILMEFTQWEKTTLENAEMLEQLRLLENGINIRMIETSSSPVSIDTPEDLERAQKRLKEYLQHKKSI